MGGRLLALVLVAATVVLVVMGTMWPIPSAAAFAGISGSGLVHSWSTPEDAVDNLANDLAHRNWARAYSILSNRGEFTEQDFIRDLTGSYPSLRTYANVDNFEVRPLHQSDSQAEVQLRLRWSTVVGDFLDTRNLQVVKVGDNWAPVWPLVKEIHVPPQVIPVNYLRWDVIYRGPADDWGAQDVDAPHVRIVDMHPIQRAAGVVVLGELLNEDVVPAFVSMKATLLAKSGSPIDTEEAFDKMSHLLLPKQVTPFLITFPNASLSDVDSIHMDPTSNLISASADPVVEIQNQKLNPAPDASFTGQLVNQSGQIVNIAHVLATLYDSSGQLVWVVDQYIDRALLPQTPVSFNIAIPQDLARKVSTERAVVATYREGGFQ
ncbi:MAG: hypothetical protein WB524_24005 [Acidobacteriaceae bacterium]|jgi:hypothetical protein